MPKGNPNSNYPPAQMTRDLESTEGFIHDTVQSITELASYGKPRNITELQNRIDQYFNFCGERNFRPGIESLSLSLSIDRTTFWRWCNGDNGVSDEWASTCKIARQMIVAFTESAAMSGHLSPPIAIFSLKNIANWKDTRSFEDLTPSKETSQDGLTASALPMLESVNNETLTDDLSTPEM